MTVNEMLEVVHDHHPSMGEKEILIVLNRSMDIFCEETEIIKDTFTFTTEASTVLYPLTPADDTVETLRIISVLFDGATIPRLVGGATIGETPDLTTNDHYWFIEDLKMGIIQGGSTATYAESGKTVTVHRIETSPHFDFTAAGYYRLTPNYPYRFHDAIVWKAIAYGYKTPPMLEPQAAAYFDGEYEKLVSKAKKYSRSRGYRGGVMVPYDM